MGMDIKFSVDLNVTSNRHKEIIDFATDQGMRRIVATTNFLTGDVDLCLRDFPTCNDNKFDIIASMDIQKPVGLKIWGCFWENSEKNIPVEWRDFSLYFGDIFFKNENYFLLSFVYVNDKWNYVFSQIKSINSLSPDAKLVCLV